MLLRLASGGAAAHCIAYSTVTALLCMQVVRLPNTVDVPKQQLSPLPLKAGLIAAPALRGSIAAPKPALSIACQDNCNFKGELGPACCSHSGEQQLHVGLSMNGSYAAAYTVPTSVIQYKSSFAMHATE